jgi:hypothetical protein
MKESPNSIQSQHGEVTGRKPSSPEERGPLKEDVNAAGKFPIAEALSPEGSLVQPGFRRREAVWGELHYPEGTGLPDVDPRSNGDPIGYRQREE